MSTLNDLIKQQEALSAQIMKMRQDEKDVALGKVHQLINENGLTQEDIFGSEKKTRQAGQSDRSDARSKVLPKYRDLNTGDEWTGRGRTPNWLNGKNKDDYLIDKSLATAAAIPKQIETTKPTTMAASISPLNATMTVKSAIVGGARALFGADK